MTITVRELAYYPVKGCAGTTVGSAQVLGTGLEHDRTFMVVDAADGAFRSQRKHPSMAAIRVEVLDGGATLTLSAEGIEPLRLDVDRDGPRREVSMFDRPLGVAADQGDEIADWFSDALGAKSRLVRVAPGFDRDGWGDTPGKVNFADAHAVLVTSMASLDGLNARIAARGDAEAVPMDRFRPNIVLTGNDEPHFEDRIRRMTIGSAELAYSVRATRCSVPLVDQRTGRRAGPEPVRTLATYRREPEYKNQVSFGAKNAVVCEGVLTVGDAVEVAEWLSR
ncbi:MULTISPECIES: MOSC domain-containing protein [unclassified Streptomyces]|uniref:MOSC domain-containing protein n=1 Tax=unclassified Streptomyces TaxID=2593676 RepID=UPI00225658A9|nr:MULTISPECIES: MOSC N-terminal beta barrel domain-containing protein [unclassified Streptomyces]WSP55051.1 MOSC N-terminal beta barrel domain-containing protein [Streptomyces sp. NBC_01241]WSU24208.1 MOSC N-terminal beta barrel domain-containing protein [Streptomyces sp. NBC_01108]MCX4786728.1 MOSC N-terminal beta barrel domain-containing protein [Streptomyces sp. NBC_01221]MCX4797499.1 MOSC N-terminal beta barrel domain-containing protein [Streptomyces sp. NBC_01242]WSP65102.1 MOSC N-termin